MNSVRIKLVFFLLFTAFLLPACTRQEEPETAVLAEAGNSTLLANQVSSMVPPGLSESDSLTWLRQFVSNWMNTELLYQMGVKNGLLNKPDVREKIDLVTRKLVAGLVLDSLGKTMDRELPDSVIQTFYDEHLEEWMARADAWLVRFFHVSEMLDASTVQNEYWLNQSWNTLRNRYGLKTEAGTDSLGQILFLDQIRLLAQDQTFQSSGENRWLIRQVKSQDNRSIVLVARLEKLYKKGTPLPIAFVRPDIVSRLNFQSRQQRIESMLDSLKRTYRVRINIQS